MKYKLEWYQQNHHQNQYSNIISKHRITSSRIIFIYMNQMNYMNNNIINNININHINSISISVSQIWYHISSHIISSNQYQCQYNLIFVILICNINIWYLNYYIISTNHCLSYHHIESDHIAQKGQVNVKGLVGSSKNSTWNCGYALHLQTVAFFANVITTNN